MNPSATLEAAKATPEDVKEIVEGVLCDLIPEVDDAGRPYLPRSDSFEAIARAILAERERSEKEHQDFRLQNDREWKAKVDHASRSSQHDPIVRNRPHLRDCPFCKANGSDSETVLFTAETDVIDQFEYGYTIRCTGCGVELHDEYEDEVIRLWNGEDKPVEED